MIEVSVAPGQLEAGQRSQLGIRFANRGSSACTDIVFKLGLPSGITLVSGNQRIDIETIRPGDSRLYSLTVEAARPGEFMLTSSNFAYRDSDDEPVRVSDWRQPLSVEARRPPPPVPPVQPRSAPRLSLNHDGAQLACEQWDILPIVVRNASGVPVSDVYVTIAGPIETNGKRGRIPTLLDGQVAKIPFNVKASDRGLVPVSVHLTYDYPDGLGSLRSWSQDGQVDVVVAQREEPATRTSTTGMPAGIRKLCVAYDVEGYSGRGTRREYNVQQRLSETLNIAFSEAGALPGRPEVQEQGDGGIAFLPTGGAVDEPRLIVGLLNALRTRLTEVNEELVKEAQVRLRVALQEGVVHRAAHGYVGPAVVEVCRLRDAPAVRSALAGSEAPMVVAVADGLYHDVLAHGYHGLPGAAFTPVDVQVKSYTGKAWIYLPGDDGIRVADRAHAKPAVQTILYLAASPKNLPHLRSDLEMRKVKEKLQLGRDRDAFRLEYCVASRLEDISQALLDFKPQVVHFSGHGDAAGGVYVEDETGLSELTNPDGLAKLFGQHRSIRCVIVNACHSARLAEAMAKYVDHSVGMRCAIGDRAAIRFSVGFYQAMFAGRPVADAFTQGCAVVESSSVTEGEDQTPVLFSRSPG
jgi:CHAT domain-containing protein